MFRVERHRIDWGFATVGTGLILLILSSLVVFGLPGAAGAVGFALTYMAFVLEGSWVGYRSVALFGGAGLLAGVLGFAFARQPLASAVILGLATLGASLGSVRRPASGLSGMFIALWALIALSIGRGDSTLEAGAAYLFGFMVAAAVAAISSRSTTATLPDPAAISPSLFEHAVYKTMAVVIAVPLGFWLFPDFPYWLALTVLIVSQPGREATVRLGLYRSVGTMIGVVAGVGLVQVLPHETGWIAVSIGIIAFLQMLFLKANYMLFAVFLTAFVVVVTALANVDEIATGWSRLLATVVGASLAIGAVWLPSSRPPSVMTD